MPHIAVQSTLVQHDRSTRSDQTSYQGGRSDEGTNADRGDAFQNREAATMRGSPVVLVRRNRAAPLASWGHVGEDIPMLGARPDLALTAAS